MKIEKSGSQMMLQWFRQNYEDAAHSVFHNARKGGYQYAPGAGPCDPPTVLQEEFPNADLKTVEEAASKLNDGTPWVRKC